MGRFQGGRAGGEDVKLGGEVEVDGTVAVFKQVEFDLRATIVCKAENPQCDHLVLSHQVSEGGSCFAGP